MLLFTSLLIFVSISMVILFERLHNGLCIYVKVKACLHCPPKIKRCAPLQNSFGAGAGLDLCIGKYIIRIRFYVMLIPHKIMSLCKYFILVLYTTCNLFFVTTEVVTLPCNKVVIIILKMYDYVT